MTEKKKKEKMEKIKEYKEVKGLVETREKVPSFLDYCDVWTAVHQQLLRPTDVLHYYCLTSVHLYCFRKCMLNL